MPGVRFVQGYPPGIPFALFQAGDLVEFADRLEEMFTNLGQTWGLTSGASKASKSVTPTQKIPPGGGRGSIKGDQP